ncbi:hypothetical protein [Leptospira sp. id769339]|uniref:hypothetical protein n=1 Tax=Leptospira sp. id769339 TaxID=2864221 RepID=UPI00214CF6E9|nr:hypothetical protein [Leptospira sp. id769339]MCR1794877.1 hypothetical protein [Leptospira sp. id769339]
MNKKEKALRAYEMTRPEPKDLQGAGDPINIDLINARDSHFAALAAKKNYIKYAIKTGVFLKNIKEQLGHGKFIPFIESNKEFLGFDRRMASNYIRAFENQSTIEGAQSMREALRLIESKEKEINPERQNAVIQNGIYKKFKKGSKLSNKEKSILKEYLKAEISRINSLLSLKVSKLKEDMDQL